MFKINRCKVIYFLISILVISIFSPIMPNKAYADELGIGAKSAILLEASTGKILYQKNPDITLPPASMTKMMTEYLVLEAVNNGTITWDQEVQISDYVYTISQNRSLSNVPLRRDRQYTVKELYEAAAIYSANGATIALSEVVAGSETNFVKMMNEKAVELGMENAEFVNTTGLNNSDLGGNHPVGTREDADNMMSVKATAKLAYHLINDYPEVLETSGISRKTFREGQPGEETYMPNWNFMLPGLVFEYEGVDGLKTGHTSLAGWCFTGTAERNGMRLISVVMQADTERARFSETKKLFDYGFGTFEKKELFPANYQIEGESILPVEKGKENEVEIASVEPISVVIKKNEEDLYTPKFEINKDVLTEAGALEAPVEKGQKIGTMALAYSGDISYGYLTEDGANRESVDIVTVSAVEKSNWFILTLQGIGGFFSDIWKSTANTVKGLFS